MVKGLLRRVAYLVSISLLLASNLAFLPALKASALAPSDWFGAGLPATQKLYDYAPSETLPTTVAGIGNRDCTTETYISRPSIPPFQSQIKQTGCAVDTPYGGVDNNGYVILNNIGQGVKIVNGSGVQTSFTPVQHSLMALTGSNAPASGVYLFFIDNIFANLQFNVTSTGEIIAKLDNPPTTTLQDRSGKRLTAQTDSLTFSDDGTWMVVDTPGSGVIRVNMQTKEVLPFAASFPYDNGLNPGLQTAISNDGRYAVISSKTYNTFKIYDLSTCGTVPDSITGPVACQSRDLLSDMQHLLPAYSAAAHIRFTSDDTLQLTAVYNSTSSPVSRSLYLVSAPGTTPTTLQYLGMGDSFAAGEGSYLYRDGTDTDASGVRNLCHQSTVSYPYLVDKDLSYNSSHSVACSGATISDMLADKGPASQATGKVGSDYNQEIFDNFLPGYRAQIDFIRQNHPDAITISVGGNDVGFADIINRCIEPDTCYSSYEDRLELVREINGKFDQLVDMYSKLKQAGKPGMRIYVVGYPEVTDPNGSCGENVRLNRDELLFANDLSDYLNTVIQRATQKAGVQYVSVQDSLDGHRLCETVYSNIAVNGVTAGNDIPFHSDVFDFLIGNESFHPNQMGQRLMKTAVLAGSNNLTAPMPVANPNATAPAEDPSLALLDMPQSGRAVNKVNYDSDLGNDVAYRSGIWQSAYSGLSNMLKPFTQVTYVLNSTPVTLGTATIDSTGSVSASLAIPSDVETGFHVLHMYGTDITGQPIDVQKVIYVAGSTTDVNGDGVADSQQACTIVPPSGQDVDRDHIDDACDGDIGTAPLPQGPLYRARNGEVSKGENSAAVYIERNVSNAYIQSLLNDSDPDGDGWAVVGVSNSTATNGTYYALTMVGDTPIVTVTQTSGCVSEKPDSLDAVVQGQTRTVSTTTQPAGVTCPVQPPPPPAPEPPKQNPIIKALQTVIKVVIAVVTAILKLFK